MCVSLHPASFSETILYLGEARHPEHGLVHVLGYQNTAINRSDEPNAMVIPVPSSTEMGPENLLDTSENSHVLKDMVDVLRPKTKGFFPDNLSAKSAGVQVFDHGIYTVVLAKDPAQIPQALDRVRQDRRPANLNPVLFNFYKDAYPGEHIALFCFNNRQAIDADPTLIWYVPQDTETFRLPALDSHTGEVPNIDAMVGVDHWVITSTFDQDEGTSVSYREQAGGLELFLPKKITGRKFSGLMENGDFITHRYFVQKGHHGYSRVRPPFFAGGLHR